MRTLPIVILVVAALGCRPERDVSQAEGAFAAVIDAYDDENAPALWNLCSAETHALLTEAHEDLKKLKKIISSEFPVGQRKQALHTAGVSLLEGAPNARALFAKVSRLEKLTFDGGVKYGAEVRENEVDAEKGVATFHTQSGQQWKMVRDKEGAWKSAHLEPLFKRHRDTVKRNLKTAEEFAKKSKEHEQAVEARFKELVRGQ